MSSTAGFQHEHRCGSKQEENVCYDSPSRKTVKLKSCFFLNSFFRKKYLNSQMVPLKIANVQQRFTALTNTPLEERGFTTKFFCIDT